MTYDARTAADFVARAHRERAAYQNLPEAIAPRTVDEAYAAQETLRDLWEPLHGPVVGLKIATTTKVMQQLMGIDHPCGGMIYQKRIHASPASIGLGDFVSLMIECELAVRVSAALPKRAEPYTRADVRAAVAEVMPAFELIEDRKAHYKSCQALSLIADNAWNGGIVLGKGVPIPGDRELDGLSGSLTIGSGAPKKEGKTDDPMGALAWIANLAADRGRPLQAGMVVITGSLIPTVPIAAGDRFRFEIADLGAAEMTAHG